MKTRLLGISCKSKARDLAVGTAFIPSESGELLWSLLRYLEKGPCALIGKEDFAQVKARRNEGRLILYRSFSQNMD